MRTRLTAVVVLILLAAGFLISYLNSISIERTLIHTAENSATLITSEFKLTIRGYPNLDSTVLSSNLHLAMKLLPEAQFIGVYSLDSNNKSVRLLTYSGTSISDSENGYLTSRLTKIDSVPVPISETNGDFVYSFDRLRLQNKKPCGYVVAKISLQKITKTVRRYQEAGALITIAVGILASILLMYALKLTFLEPFNEFGRAMLAAADGNLRTRLSIQTGAEFRKLSLIFNEMMDRLEEAHEVIAYEMKSQENFNERLQHEIDQATERIRKQSNEIITLQEKLRIFESQAAMSKAAAKLAHEVGSPLNAVYTSVQLLLEQNVSPEAQKKLQLIERQVEKMIAIINSSLRDSEASSLLKKQITVRNLIDETKMIVDLRLTNEGIEFRTKADDPLLTLEIDPIQIQQVLINLINNAADAIRDNTRGNSTTEKFIELHVWKETKNNVEVVHIDVSDNGGGVPDEMVPKLFNEYISSKKPHGNGMGLIICKEIAEKHGGKLYLSRNGPAVTTFSLEIPIKQVNTI
ncbi:MAG: sensor histidine kinase [Candidatus Kryptoniota bacterium]